jgi:signal transduction histidine kinase
MDWNSMLDRAPSSSSDSSSESLPLRLLIVEDNPGDADLLREALSGKNAAIDHVERIADALASLAARAPDAILLDLSLPDASGFEGLRALRQAVPQVPVVVITSLDDEVLGRQAVREGAEDYLPKSEIGAHAVYRAVRYAIERNRSRSGEKTLAIELAARAEMERMSQIKDRFLAVLAHELRNPLAPMKFALEILRQPGASGETVNRARDVLQRQVALLARLVNDLLDVSRISRGKLSLQKERVSLGAMIAAAEEAVAPAIRQYGHSLQVSAPLAGAEMVADGARIIQVFTNLLHNAAKFTPAGGSISLEARMDQGEAHIRVRDSGIGFDAEAPSRLFDMYHQEESTVSASGLGVGLALARQLVEMHGGTISASSPGKGLGAEFVVRLPDGLDKCPEPVSAASPPSKRTAARLRVLIVDDNADAADTLAFFVGALGHESRVAYEGRTALAIAREFEPDLALLDIGLPGGMDGYELAANLREPPFDRGIYLVAVTGWGQPQDQRHASEAGFDRHYTKPMKPAKLEELLNGLSSRPATGLRANASSHESPPEPMNPLETTFFLKR